MANDVRERCERCAAAVLGGLTAHVVAARMILTRPSLLAACVPGLAITACSALLLAVALFVPCALSLSLSSLVLPSHQTASGYALFESLLRTTSWTIASLRPGWSGGAFLAAYDMLAPEQSAKLRRRRVLRGLLATILREVLSYLLTGLGTLALLVATAGLWVPLACAAAALLTPLVVATCLGAVVAAAAAGRLLAPSLALFSHLRPVSLGVALAAAACALLGVLPPHLTETLIALGSQYALSTPHAESRPPPFDDLR